MSTIPILPSAASSGAATPTASPSPTSSQGLNTMFMQLLMAQLKNQSPLDPMDPTQFVGQLAQFSELSTVTSIYQLLQQSVSGGSSSGSTQPTGHAAGAAEPPGTPVAVSAPLSFSAPPEGQAIYNFASTLSSTSMPKIQGVF